MAIASILVGILSGLTSFFAALILGHGVAIALGLYAFGGLVGAVAIIVIGALRSHAVARPSQTDGETASA